MELIRVKIQFSQMISIQLNACINIHASCTLSYELIVSSIGYVHVFIHENNMDGSEWTKNNVVQDSHTT